MKKILFSTMLLAGLFGVSAQTASPDVSTLDYGKIKKGADGSRFFTITNKGDKPLQIIKATPACGCTTPEVPTEPIAPGASAKMKVGYDTNRIGAFSKTIGVETNDPVNKNLTLTISGEILPDETAPAPSFNPAALPTAPTAVAVSAVTEKVKDAVQKGKDKVKSVKDKVNATKDKVKVGVANVTGEKTKTIVTEAVQQKGQTPPAPANPHAGHGH